MKSRIRFRWHRPNEKPLENGGTPATLAAPVGQIDPSDSSALKDDLSNFKPEQTSAKQPRKQEHRKGPRNDREKSGNRRRPPRDHQRNKHTDLGNQSEKRVNPNAQETIRKEDQERESKIPSMDRIKIRNRQRNLPNQQPGNPKNQHPSLQD